MSYIGKAPGFGIRNRYYYTATASQTTFSGADDNGQTLAYADSKYLDVYLNGVLLVAGTDYTATTLTSVTLTSGAAASDIVEIVAYDIFSVADTVSAKNGGTFDGAVTVDSTLTASGLVTAQDGLVVDNDGATVATFDRATSDGDIVEFQKDGTTVGNIGVFGGDALYIGDSLGGGTGLRFDSGGADDILPCSGAGATRDNAIDLGNSSSRFKDLYLSGGVYLGGTTSANFLDDYEKGTFTVTTAGDSTGSFTNATGDYIKVGKMVSIKIAFDVAGNFASTSIGGLPFTVGGATGVSSVGQVAPVQTQSTSSSPILAHANIGNTTIAFSTGTGLSGHTPNTSNDVYRFGLTYFID